MRLNRRHFLAATCACCYPTTLAHATDEDDFVCATPQFEPGLDIIDEQAVTNFSLTDSGDFVVGGDDEEEISIQDFANALGSKLWRRSHSEQPIIDKTRLRIGVAFLNGSNQEKSTVKSIAGKWSEYLPIDLVYDNPKFQRIRIKFGAAGNQSAIGTNALGYASDAPTMTFNSVNSRSVLHEFGHALAALRHEHKHPAAQLEWNIDVIAADLGWGREKVISNFVGALSKSYSCRGSGTYDPNSIMHYPIRKSWTKQRIVVTGNSKLSAGDIECAKTLYKSL